MSTLSGAITLGTSTLSYLPMDVSFSDFLDYGYVLLIGGAAGLARGLAGRFIDKTDMDWSISECLSRIYVGSVIAFAAAETVNLMPSGNQYSWIAAVIAGWEGSKLMQTLVGKFEKKLNEDEQGTVLSQAPTVSSTTEDPV